MRESRVTIYYHLGCGLVRGKLGCLLRDISTGLGVRKYATFYGRPGTTTKCWDMRQVLKNMAYELHLHTHPVWKDTS
jgi:hypothetical protein